MGNCLAAEYVNKSGNKCCREGLRANCNPLPQRGRGGNHRSLSENELNIARDGPLAPLGERARVRGTGSAGANILLVEEAPPTPTRTLNIKGERLPAPPLVRLESELLQVFQNSIKQLQCCNNEFEDKNGDIHQGSYASPVVQEHCQLTYLSAACCQLLCTRYLKEKRCAC